MNNENEHLSLSGIPSYKSIAVNKGEEGDEGEKGVSNTVKLPTSPFFRKLQTQVSLMLALVVLCVIAISHGRNELFRDVNKNAVNTMIVASSADEEDPDVPVADAMSVASSTDKEAPKLFVQSFVDYEKDADLRQYNVNREFGRCPPDYSPVPRSKCLQGIQCLRTYGGRPVLKHRHWRLKYDPDPDPQEIPHEFCYGRRRTWNEMRLRDRWPPWPVRLDSSELQGCYYQMRKENLRMGIGCNFQYYWNDEGPNKTVSSPSAEIKGRQHYVICGYNPDPDIATTIEKNRNEFLQAARSFIGDDALAAMNGDIDQGIWDAFNYLKEPKPSDSLVEGDRAIFGLPCEVETVVNVIAFILGIVGIPTRYANSVGKSMLSSLPVQSQRRITDLCRSLFQNPEQMATTVQQIFKIILDNLSIIAITGILWKSMSFWDWLVLKVTIIANIAAIVFTGGAALVIKIGLILIELVLILNDANDCFGYPPVVLPPPTGAPTGAPTNAPTRAPITAAPTPDPPPIEDCFLPPMPPPTSPPTSPPTFPPTLPPTSRFLCGGHNARHCKACPYVGGKWMGPTYCNGNCHWYRNQCVSRF